ncbi:envelope stress response membrane protein PspB [Sphingomonas sp.]|uniref:envelope stress response membrane protein PspB n=1 Tax=Sphingomonas sp. TaxID=28214 RepID=UPI00286B02B0|nr:envelope stress response membrane protein PspB [Sphingomonas sp.]
MEDIFVPMIAIGVLFLGLPWLVFHYITKWKTASRLTGGDEKLLDELYDSARRLDDRLCSIERIMTAENPNWKQQCLPEERPSQRLLGDVE